MKTNVPAGPGREERRCNPRNTLPPLVPMNRRKRPFHMVFMTIRGPQALGDRLAGLPSEFGRTADTMFSTAAQ